jgi:hypothetical protein
LTNLAGCYCGRRAFPLRGYREGDHCFAAGLHPNVVDSALNLMREPLDQSKTQSSLRWDLHALAIIFDQDAGFTRIAGERKAASDPSAVVAKSVFNRIGYELVDDKAYWNSTVDRNANTLRASISTVISDHCGTRWAQSDRR